MAPSLHTTATPGPEPRLGGMRSVPAVAGLEAPGAARRAVAVPDVPEAPADLRLGIVGPVGAGGGHLGAGQCLGNAVGRGRGVVRVDVPAALLAPDAVQAAELRGAQAV